MLVPNIHSSHASKTKNQVKRMITINAKSDGIKYNRVIHIPQKCINYGNTNRKDSNCVLCTLYIITDSLTHTTDLTPCHLLGVTQSTALFSFILHSVCYLCHVEFFLNFYAWLRNIKCFLYSVLGNWARFSNTMTFFDQHCCFHWVKHFAKPSTTIYTWWCNIWLIRLRFCCFSLHATVLFWFG